MHPIIFYLPGKRSRRWKVLQRTTNLFLVELIQTVVSTVETGQTEPTGRSTSARSLRPHLVIYILFFLVVFFFIILSVVCSETSNVHKRPWAPHATSVHVPPNSSEVVMGGKEEEEEEEEGSGNMLLGRWNRKKGKWKWRQLSFSGIMSLEADWCQSSWCHWGLLWFDPRSPPVVSAPAVPEDTDKWRLILWHGRISHTAL